MKKNAFTLIEILLVVVIVVIFSVLVFADYKNGEQQLALQRSANKLAQDLRRAAAKTLGLESSSVCLGGYANYGVHFSIYSSSSYVLFADCGNDDYQYATSEKISEIALEKNIKITGLSFGTILDVVFEAPDPTVHFTSAAATSSITLGVGSRAKTVFINQAGLIEIK